MHLEVVEVDECHGQSARGRGALPVRHGTFEHAAVAEAGERVVGGLVVAVGIEALALDGDGRQVHEAVDDGEVIGRGRAAIAVVHAEDAEQAAIGSEHRRAPRGLDAVMRGEVAERAPQRIGADVLADDALLAEGGGAAAAGGGAWRHAVDGVGEGGRERCVATLAEALRHRVEDQDRRLHRGNGGLGEPGDGAQGLGERRGARHQLKDLLLGGQELLGDERRCGLGGVCHGSNAKVGLRRRRSKQMEEKSLTMGI